MNIPNDMNSIAKMVNDTLRSRKKGSLNMKKTPIPAGEPITVVVSDIICSHCERPSLSAVRWIDGCDCPCHPVSGTNDL